LFPQNEKGHKIWRNERVSLPPHWKKVLLPGLYTTCDTKDNNAEEIKQESQNLNANSVLILGTERHIKKNKWVLWGRKS